jgi:sporulation protein YlmC with PRC-barrel domain
MPHYGTLNDVAGSTDIEDIKGATVYGLEDEKIGKIDDVIVDHETGEVRYAVVDSGGWLKSHKFLVPADRLGARGGKDDEFVVPVTKQQIENFPPYDEKLLNSEADWATFDADYKKGWHANPVLHQAGSDRIITPQQPARSGASGSSLQGQEEGIPASDLYPERIADKFSDATPGGQKLTMRPQGTVSRAEDAAYGSSENLAPRWTSFRERVRQNWGNTRKQCGRCADTGQEIDRDVA